MERKGIGSVRNYNPREYQNLLMEQLMDAQDVRMSVDTDELFVMNLPRILTPDNWKKVAEMIAAGINLQGKGIEIINPPKGSHPNIARGWIGTRIPFSDDLPPVAYITEEMRQGGMSSSDDRVYVVKGTNAVTSLEQDFFTTAHVYKNYNPIYASQMLFFDSDSSRIIDFPQPNDNQTILSTTS